MTAQLAPSRVPPVRGIFTDGRLALARESFSVALEAPGAPYTNGNFLTIVPGLLPRPCLYDLFFSGLSFFKTLSVDG